MLTFQENYCSAKEALIMRKIIVYAKEALYDRVSCINYFLKHITPRPIPNDFISSIKDNNDII